MLVLDQLEGLTRVVDSVLGIFLFLISAILLLLLFSLGVAVGLPRNLIRLHQRKKFAYKLFRSFSDHVLRTIETQRILHQHVNIFIQTVLPHIVAVL